MSGRPFSKLDWQDSLRGAEMTADEFRVLITVSGYANSKTGANAYPGVENLARHCRIHARSVKRILRRLEEKGWLIVTKPGGRHGGRTMATVYRLGRPKAVVVEVPMTADVGVAPDTPANMSGVPGGATIAPTWVTSGSQMGDPTVQQDGPQGHPNRLLEPVTSNLPKEEHLRGSARTPTPDIELMADDFDTFEVWLMDELGHEPLSPIEFSTAHGMWESRSNPRAILNKLRADTRPDRETA